MADISNETKHIAFCVKPCEWGVGTYKCTAVAMGDYLFVVNRPPLGGRNATFHDVNDYVAKR